MVVLAPGARAWEMIAGDVTYRVAMLLATGQTPYGDFPGWRRTIALRWQQPQGA